MQQFESVAAKRSECDTAISAFEAVLPSMHPFPDRDETVQSGGGSVPTKVNQGACLTLTQVMIQSPS